MKIKHTGSHILTLITYLHTFCTRRMKITSAINRTILPRPSQFTFARIIWIARADAIFARMITRFHTVIFAVSVKADFAFTNVRGIRIDTYSFRMAVVNV